MSKKRENTLFNMASSLFLITVVAALTLAGVYSFTKEPIEKVKQEIIRPDGLNHNLFGGHSRLNRFTYSIPNHPNGNCKAYEINT